MGARRTITVVFGIVLALVAASGCSSGKAHPVTTPNAADKAFLQDMIPHHQQAIAAAQVAITHGHDARVTAFGSRIVSEQSPELAKLKQAGADLHLDLAAGVMQAMHVITPPELTALSALTGAGFDRQFLQLSITSEQGAAAMARTELAGGRNPAALALAKAISGAPSSEIPKLQELLADV